MIWMVSRFWAWLFGKPLPVMKIECVRHLVRKGCLPLKVWVK